MSKFKINILWGFLLITMYWVVQIPIVIAQTSSSTSEVEVEEEEEGESSDADEESDEEEEEGEEEDDDESDDEVVFEKVLSYEQYAPKFSVKLRKESQLEFFPCMDCHEDEEPNFNIRELEDEHEDITLEHGGERFWCLTCHQSPNRDYLRSLKNNAIDFDQSHRLCGQCHFQRQKDWYYGGHGKRVGNWNGERKLMLCTECHDPHSPSIKPVKPNLPPEVRKGLVFVPSVAHHKPKVWEKNTADHSKEKHD